MPQISKAQGGEYPSGEEGTRLCCGSTNIVSPQEVYETFEQTGHDPRHTGHSGYGFFVAPAGVRAPGFPLC